MSLTNTLFIVIDPSGAQAGAQATNNAINSVVSSANGLNVAINNVSINLRNLGNTNTSPINRLISDITKNFSDMVGMFAAIQPVHIFASFIDQIREVDRVYNSFIGMMTVTTKDVNKSAQEYEYVAKTAKAYGVELEVLLKSYSKLAASTSGMLTENQTKRLFESFTAVSTVLHADQQTVERMFNAIIQMASKGQVYMEELKQQLGEHLPGALALAATAMNMTIGQLLDKIKKGEVSAKEFLSKLPQTLMDRFGKAAEVAASSLNASFSRLRSTWFDLFKSMSTNGISLGLSKVLTEIDKQLSGNSYAFKLFSDKIGEALLQVANFINQLKPEDLVKFADAIIQVVSAGIDFVVFLTKSIVEISKHYEEVKLLIEVYLGFKIVVLGLMEPIARFAAAQTALAASATGTAAITATAYSLMARGVVYALGTITAFILGWEIGTYLKDKYVEVEQFGIALAAGIHKTIVEIGGWYEELKIKIPLYLAEAFENAINKINVFFATLKSYGNQFMSFLGLDEIKDIQPLKLDFTSGLRADLEKTKKDNAKNIKDIEDGYFHLFQAAEKTHAQKKQSGGLIESFGLSQKDFDDARNLMANFKKLEEEAKGAIGEDHTPTVTELKALRQKNAALVQSIKNVAAEYLNELDEFSASVQRMVKENQISSTQAIDAQIQATINYYASAASTLEKAKKYAANPKEIELLNKQIESYNSKSKVLVTQLQEDRISVTESGLKMVEDAEEASGIRRLSEQEKFIQAFQNNYKKGIIEALLDGDTDLVNRYMRAFQIGVESIDLSAKVKTVSKTVDTAITKLHNREGKQSVLESLFGTDEDVKRIRQTTLPEALKALDEFKAKLDELGFTGTAKDNIIIQIEAEKEKIRKAMEQLPPSLENLSRDISDALAHGIMFGFSEGDSFSKTFAKMLQNYVYKELSKTINDLLDMLMRGLLNAQSMSGGSGGGGGLGGFGGIISGALGLMGGGAAIADILGPAVGGAVSSAAVSAVGVAPLDYAGYYSVANLIDPLANGGIMTPDGLLPLQKYLGGGIATEPQLAYFGEGSMNEAFVPLPDGRNIPVKIQNGSSSVHNNHQNKYTVNVQVGNNSPKEVKRSAAEGARAGLGMVKRMGRYG